MGAELSQYRNRMSLESWQYVLDMLIETCDVLTAKRQMEVNLKTAVAESFETYDLYKKGTAGNIVGRIHFTPEEPITLASIIENYPGDTKQMEVKKEDAESEFMLKFGIDQTPGSVLPAYLLNRIPEAWTEANIANTKEILVKMKEESEYFHEVRYGIDDRQQDDIFPPRPPPGREYGESVSWTAFGLFTRSKDKRRNVISNYVSKLEGRMFKDRAIIYKDNPSNIVAQILPKEWLDTIEKQKQLTEETKQ